MPETYLHHDEIERLLPTMAFRAEVMKNRGVENFYRLSSVDPAQAGRSLRATGRPAQPIHPPSSTRLRSRGFLEIAGVVSSCQGPQGWAFPSLALTEDVDLLLQ